MNSIELFVILAAWVILAAYYIRGGYNKHAIPYIFVSLPILFLSINMVSEIITADEYQYMIAFIDMKNIKDYACAFKALHTYRTSQMLFGSFFSIIPESIKSYFDTNELIRGYKILHYFVFFLISIGISWIWRNKILDKDISNIRFRIADNAILYCLLALPVSCLMLKVCNYDASNVYFAILGFSLIIAAEKESNLRLAYAGTIAAAFGCLDKWSNLLYWCICAMFFVYIGVRVYQKWYLKLLNAFKYGIICIGSAITISWLNLVYLKLLAGGELYSDINSRLVLFPFTYMLQILFVDNKMTAFDDEIFSNGIIRSLIIIMILIIVCALLLVLFDLINKKMKLALSRLLTNVNAILLSVCIISGILAAYFIPQFLSPFKEIEEGFYNSTDSFNSVIYHFGAVNGLQHFIHKVAYAFATILCNYPTVVLLILGLNIYLYIKKSKELMENYFIHIIMFICTIFPILFSVAGQPAGERYYGVTILMMAIISVYNVYNSKIHFKYNRIIACIVCIGFIGEMLIYVPNIKIFSPIWVVHSLEYKNTIRKGEWYAGESMTWGEDMAIAGNMIKDMVDNEGVKDYSDISIYGNYGHIWLGNPGFNIGVIDKGVNVDGYKWDNTEYMVLSKFKLYRYDIPDFIYSIEPVATIKYNGEVSSWIYTGDQLKEYKEYFE